MIPLRETWVPVPWREVMDPSEPGPHGGSVRDDFLDANKQVCLTCALADCDIYNPDCLWVSPEKKCRSK